MDGVEGVDVTLSTTELWTPDRMTTAGRDPERWAG
jgi:metal-sulfur cluster biosynthetic enzyme